MIQKLVHLTYFLASAGSILGLSYSATRQTLAGRRTDGDNSGVARNEVFAILHTDGDFRDSSR